MANGSVPWPGPVPAPGESNVVMVGCVPIRGVLVKFRKPSLVPLKAVGARIPSSNIEVMATASRRAEVKVFLKCVLMFLISFVEFFMTTL
jgi:hypothetical protein